MAEDDLTYPETITAVAGLEHKIEKILGTLETKMRDRIVEHAALTSFYGDYEAQRVLSEIDPPMITSAPVNPVRAKAPAISRAEKYLDELKRGGSTINGEWVEWFTKYSPSYNAGPLHDIIMKGVKEGKPVGRWDYRPEPGEGYPDKTVADDIMAQMDQNYKSGASRIARTETGRFLNIGSLDRYGEAGVQKVRVHDGDGCATCALINGEVWTIDEAYQRTLEHPNCKRSFRPVVPGYDPGASPDESPMPENDPGSDQYLGE